MAMTGRGQLDVELGSDVPATLFVGELPGDGRPQITVTIGEEPVGGMVGVQGLGHEHREQPHQPGERSFSRHRSSSAPR